MTPLANVDIPYQGIVQPAGAFYVAGWAFVGETGVSLPPVLGVALFEYATGLWTQLDVMVHDHLARPDVAAAYAGTWPLVTGNAGYALYPTTPPRAGRYRLWISWGTTDGAVTQQPIEVTLT